MSRRKGYTDVLQIKHDHYDLSRPITTTKPQKNGSGRRLKEEAEDQDVIMGLQQPSIGLDLTRLRTLGFSPPLACFQLRHCNPVANYITRILFSQAEVQQVRVQSMQPSWS